MFEATNLVTEVEELLSSRPKYADGFFARYRLQDLRRGSEKHEQGPRTSYFSVPIPSDARTLRPRTVLLLMPRGLLQPPRSFSTPRWSHFKATMERPMTNLSMGGWASTILHSLLSMRLRRYGVDEKSGWLLVLGLDSAPFRSLPLAHSLTL